MSHRVDKNGFLWSLQSKQDKDNKDLFCFFLYMGDFCNVNFSISKKLKNKDKKETAACSFLKMPHKHPSNNKVVASILCSKIYKDTKIFLQIFFIRKEMFEKEKFFSFF